MRINMLTLDDDQLVKDYEHFTQIVMQCYTYLISGEKDKARDMIALTAGQAIGFAARLGYDISKLKPPTPWERLGISRSTYYRDMRRSRANDDDKARTVNIGPADIPATFEELYKNK
jgi:hypothetical protein